jgi:chromosomal replication initiator protein
VHSGLLASPLHTGIGSDVDRAMEAHLERAITQRIGADRYNMWFRGGNTKFVLLKDEFLVGVPNLMYQEWLHNTFSEEIREAVREIVGPNVPVRFAIDPELFRAARAEQQRVANNDPPPDGPQPQAKSQPELEPVKKVKPKTEERAPRSQRKWRSLKEFVVGACNRVAHASAISVVEEPGQGANPLVVYGPVGTGKTHLLEGVYLGMRKRWTDLTVRFTTAEEFTNAFVQSMHQGKQSSFRRQFRDCSVLLVDDLNFLAGKKQTQVEFLHTLDALLADNRQVVLSTDSHPRLTEDLLPELVDRLLGGAVWSLLPPDAATRLDLLRCKSASSAPPIPEEVLNFIAQQLRGNVRELEGAIHSLRHYSRCTGRAIDQALAREALGDLLRHAIRVVGIRDVDAGVCSILRIPAGSLQAKNRAWSVSHPRMIAIYLCRKHTAATYSEIGMYFNNQTHSSAVAAEKKVLKWIESNANLKVGEREWRVRDLVERIERELGR